MRRALVFCGQALAIGALALCAAVLIGYLAAVAVVVLWGALAVVTFRG